MSQAAGLERFVDAQAPVYAEVVEELKAGRKATHWMWFVFPQLRGLGRSPMADYYGIASLDEARAFAAHPLLGARLRQCVDLVLAQGNRSLEDLFGPLDALKFRSSMTLFENAVPGEGRFGAALDAMAGGARDGATLALLAAA